MKAKAFEILIVVILLITLSILLTHISKPESYKTFDFYIDPNDTTDCVFNLPEGTRAISVNDLRDYYKRFNEPEPNEPKNVIPTWPQYIELKKDLWFQSEYGLGIKPKGNRIFYKPDFKEDE